MFMTSGMRSGMRRSFYIRLIFQNFGSEDILEFFFDAVLASNW